VNAEHACLVLLSADDLHLDDLQANVLDLLLKSGEPCLESKSFRSLSPECLRLVIESDNRKCKEEIIYQKILEWSTNRCQDQCLQVNDENIRQVLGDLLYLVRFPIMERKYFTENVSKKRLLSSDEIVKV
jgi:BTB/POZ domain-containing protein 1/2